MVKNGITLLKEEGNFDVIFYRLLCTLSIDVEKVSPLLHKSPSFVKMPCNYLSCWDCCNFFRFKNDDRTHNVRNIYA